MMLDWAWLARRRMDASGFGAVCAVMLTCALAGPTHAIFLSLLLAVGSSHLRASKLRALKYHASARSVHPPVSRSLEAQAVLVRLGGAIHIIGLEGFVYEGTMAKLLRYILQALQLARGEIRFLLLDLAAVQGIDPSACALLGRASRVLHDRKVTLVLVETLPSLLPMLTSHGVLPDPADAAGSAAATSVGAAHASKPNLAPDTAPTNPQGPFPRAASYVAPTGTDAAVPAIPALGSRLSSFNGRSAMLNRGRVRGLLLCPLRPSSLLSGTGLPTGLPTAAARSGSGSGCEVGGVKSGSGSGSKSMRPRRRGCGLLFDTLENALMWAEDALLREEMGNSPISPNSAHPTTPGTASNDSSDVLQPSGRQFIFRPYALAVQHGSLGPPYAPSGIWNAQCSWEALLPFGSLTMLPPGSVLTEQGVTNKEIFFTPPTVDVPVELSVDVGHAAGELRLLTACHGAAYGLEGALLGVPTLATARVLGATEPSSTAAADLLERRGGGSDGVQVLVIGGFGLSKLRTAQPALLQHLLGAAFTQQQDLTAMLARRATLWRSGGWAGAHTEPRVAPHPRE